MTIIDRQDPVHPAEGERTRLMRDALAYNLWVPVSAVIGILLVPFMLRTLGQDSYGIWIVAASMSGIVGAADFGLYWSIGRVVADDPGGSRGDNGDFVVSAANVYALIGLAGCVVLGVAGILTLPSLRLPPVGHGTVGLVFWLFGGALFADRLGMYGTAVLAGLRRFKLISLIGTLATITWAAGAVLVLAGGGGVAGVAVCQFTVAALKAVVTLWMVGRLVPNFRFRPFFLRWSALRRHVSFAVPSFMTDLLAGVVWNSAPVLIGFMGGSAAAVPFYIGQKFPLAVSAIGSRAAEVLFPAATENRHDPVRSAEVLGTGSRWVMVMALPSAVVLFVAAPELLRAWIGDPPPGSVAVLRALAAVVVADGVLMVPLHFLWGRGEVRPIFITYVGLGVAVMALTLVLVGPLGVAGAAIGMLAALTAGAAVLLTIAARQCSLDPWRLLAGSLKGLWLPVLGCLASALAVLHFRGEGRLWVFAAMAAGGLVYMALLGTLSGNMDEKRLAYNIYRRLRSTAARIPFLRSAFHLAVALFEFLWDPWSRPSYFERLFKRPDPWRYETGVDRKRLMKAASMLEGAAPGKFRNALEIACAEGMFTELLAPRCESLLAVDFAPTALGRARQRVPLAHVRFEEFDLRHDPIPGKFDLITAMDVICTIFRPAAVRAVREKLVAGLEPGGCLLFVSTRQGTMFETEWWGRLLMRGGENIRSFFGSHPSLRLVSSYTTDTHVYALFRKEQG